MSITQIIYYTILFAITLLLFKQGKKVKSDDLENSAIRDIFDRPTWIVGGIILAILPIWWPFPFKNIITAILTPLLGITITGGLAMIVLGSLLDATNKKELFIKLASSLIVATLLIYLITKFLR